MSLHLLLDNADPDIWREWLPSGIFEGITTNPTLLKRAGQPCTLSNIKILAKEAEKLGCKELHLQAWGTDSKDLYSCGKALGELTTKDLKIYL